MPCRPLDQPILGSRYGRARQYPPSILLAIDPRSAFRHGPAKALTAGPEVGAAAFWIPPGVRCARKQVFRRYFIQIEGVQLELRAKTPGALDLPPPRSHCVKSLRGYNI